MAATLVADLLTALWTDRSGRFPAVAGPLPWSPTHVVRTEEDGLRLEVFPGPFETADQAFLRWLELPAIDAHLGVAPAPTPDPPRFRAFARVSGPKAPTAAELLRALVGLCVPSPVP